MAPPIQQALDIPHTPSDPGGGPGGTTGRTTGRTPGRNTGHNPLHITVSHQNSCSFGRLMVIVIWQSIN